MKSTEIKFNPDIPGWINIEEVGTITSLINGIEFDTILEAGACAGRLTWTLCKTFPDKIVTALDTFAGDTALDRIGDYHTTTLRDERYLGKKNTLEYFKILQTEHLNLNTIKCNFIDYKYHHDIIILSIDAKGIDWNKIYDHALSLNPKLIIGRHGRPHRTDVLNSLLKYQYYSHDQGVYVLHNKL
jgi:hypothetical protein